ncbi:pre-mRNA-splicing factor cwf23-like [Macadamia integrifolia]|uniref:pre-mRNA-splicing factor cwf23-like n=1 Tax=Macadamia integrifolia TaxID=60698 RepID=UPI001C4F462F|nr:pre-mRNA-splicing factor cwf23-like [Macadamia integrifolia]
MLEKEKNPQLTDQFLGARVLRLGSRPKEHFRFAYPRFFFITSRLFFHLSWSATVESDLRRKRYGVKIDHYEILGLPSGEERAKLTEREISKAYKTKALEIHPDKRPNDLNAHSEFQKLKSSYGILKDDKTRKLFDDLLRIRLVQRCKLRKLMSDLEELKRDLFLLKILLQHAKTLEEIEMIVKKIKDEQARKQFDDLLRIKHEESHLRSQYDAKYRKIVSDIEKVQSKVILLQNLVGLKKALEEIERIVKRVKEENARIRGMYA